MILKLDPQSRGNTQVTITGRSGKLVARFRAYGWLLHHGNGPLLCADGAEDLPWGLLSAILYKPWPVPGVVAELIRDTAVDETLWPILLDALMDDPLTKDFMTALVALCS